MVTALNLAFEGFCLAKQANAVSDRTIEAYRLMFTSLVRHLPPEKLNDIRNLTADDLRAWVIHLRETLATATCDQRIAKARAFFGWCCSEGLITSNPMAGIKRPRPNWQPNPLNADEIAALLQAARRGRAGVRNYAIICLLLDSGMRSAELRSLRPDDLSLKTGQIRVREGKGGKPRTVLVGRRTADALWRWLMVRPESEWLFCTERGRPLSRKRVEVIVQTAGRRAGISRCYPHRLRHTFALIYLKNRGDPFSLQYLLGHEDMTMVRQYVKIAAQDAREMYRSPLDSLPTV